MPGLRGAGWLVAGLVALACSSSTGSQPRVAVFAASSLTDVLGAMAESFRGKHPGVEVELAFAGSQVLRLQLEQGARADVFISANEQHVEGLRSAGLVHDPRRLVGSELTLIVPVGEAGAPTTFGELDRAGRIVVGSPHVPLGVYTDRLWKRARSRMGDGFVDRVQRNIVSRENNARLVRAKVELGEADAAIVYRTDARSSQRVRERALPQGLSPRAQYVLATVGDAGERREVSAWVRFVHSGQARSIWRRHGFEVGEP